MESWKSKPCGPCGCPYWDHGGVSGCRGNPDRPCDGCAGYIPDEDADDIICSEERQSYLLKCQEYMRLMILEKYPNTIEDLKKEIAIIQARIAKRKEK